MRYFLSAVAILLLCTSWAPQKMNNIYDFRIKSLTGGVIDFKRFKGKKILVVNTASKCGYTPQYKALEALYQAHQGELVIVGFPSDNFGGQEYEADKDIAEFCQKNYGVTFPLTTRVDVKGDKAAPIFKYLCNKEENGVLDASIKWNFNKFVIDEQGKLVAHFGSKVTPDDPELLKALGY